MADAALAEQQPKEMEQTWPMGTVTLLFSDIEGFTAYVEQYGDEAAQELAERHNAIVREQLSAHNGMEVKTLGDGLMAAFSSSRQAILCAVDIQKAIRASSDAGPTEALSVGIGIDAGEPVYNEQDFVGQAVNRAARIADQAEGGEIVVSDVVRGLAGQTVGVELRDRGEHDLKGVAETQRLHEVIWEGESATQPRLDLAELGRQLGQEGLTVKLNAARLLGTSLKAILKGRQLLIWLPFLGALLALNLGVYLVAGPSMVDFSLRSASTNTSFLLASLIRVLIFVIVLSPIVAAMIVRMTVNAAEGQRLLPWREVGSFVVENFGKLLRANLLYFVLPFVGFIVLSGIIGFSSALVMDAYGLADASDLRRYALFYNAPLLIPLYYIWARLSLYVPGILFEGRGPLASLRWSWRATANNGMTLFWLALVPALVFAAVMFWAFPSLGLAWASDAAPSYINPWSLAAITLAYLKLRDGWASLVAKRAQTATSAEPAVASAPYS